MTTTLQHAQYSTEYGTEPVTMAITGLAVLSNSLTTFAPTRYHSTKFIRPCSHDSSISHIPAALRQLYLLQHHPTQLAKPYCIITLHLLPNANPVAHPGAHLIAPPGAPIDASSDALPDALPDAQGSKLVSSPGRIYGPSREASQVRT